MSRIGATETNPEILVRKFLFSKGFRFRKNVKTLPGKPDIVLSKFQTVIFIHGCFWHGHKNCKKATLPTTNRIFWKNKIEGNIKRDQKVKRELNREDWKVITVWGCKLKSKKVFEKEGNRLLSILNN
jgi:DNA mismatch endonuclease, patch repair protein